jgi:NADH:ubiquinone oxidoreductase subunit 3 (subunit A)
MDPSSIMNSVTGVVAIVMIFGLPIVAVVGAFVVALVASQKKHKERMKMIEQGMIPPPTRRRTGNFYGLIITGAILFAFGLALLVGELATKGGDLEGGLIFGFVGLALVIVYTYLRIVRKKEPQPPDAPPPPAQP